MPVDNANKSSPFMTRRIIWFAMVQGVIFIYGILIYKGITSPNPPPADYEMIKYIFLLISATTLLSLGKIKSLIENTPSTILSPTPKRSESKANTSFFIIMAICEASILFGAILAYISGNLHDLYILTIPGGIGMLLNFPRNEE